MIYRVTIQHEYLFDTDDPCFDEDKVIMKEDGMTYEELFKMWHKLFGSYIFFENCYDCSQSFVKAEKVRDKR